MTYIKNKIISIVLIVCLLVTMFTIPATGNVNTSEEVVYGDVNMDGNVNASDALRVLQRAAHLIGEFEFDYTNKILVAADVDANEIVNATDAFLILQYAAKIITSFPCENLFVTETPIPEVTPSPKPVFGVPVVNVTVKNHNDVAKVEGDLITFLSPKGHYDGVEMNNPFAGRELDDGATISFWYTPTDEIDDLYGYTSLLTFSNLNSSEIIKFDVEGTRQYNNRKSCINDWEADFTVEEGKDYFMTCVISSKGISYYANGSVISSGKVSLIDSSTAMKNLIPMITNSETQLFIGGTNNIWPEMAEIASHELSENTKVKSVKVYMKAMTREEVKALYNLNNPDATDEPEETNSPEATATPKPALTDPSFSGTVWIVGDSIAAKHKKEASVRPLYGWGEVISDYYADVITFQNMAISSQSTSSYYNLHRVNYDHIFNNLKERDYIIISFGHNDHNDAKLSGFNRVTNPEESSDTENSYKWWLKNYYIDPALEKGATPILMSSVVRCSYSNNEFIEEEVHLKYGKAMKELVDEYAEKGIIIYFLDAQTYTYNLYSGLKSIEAREYHGQYGPEGGSFFDNTHYSEAGARMISEFISTELKKYSLSINNYLK